MAFCQGELFFWTLKESTLDSEEGVGVHRLHEKNEAADWWRYREERMLYAEGRSISWTPSNRRQDKLRDSLREMEQLLAAHKIVGVAFPAPDVIKMLLGNAVLITINLRPENGDLDRLLVDRYLVGRFSSSSSSFSSSLLLDSFVVVASSEKNRVDYAFLRRNGDANSEPSPTLKARRSSSGAGGVPAASAASSPAPEKLSQRDPKLGQVEIPGPTSGRRVERNLCVNESQDLLLVWWRGGALVSDSDAASSRRRASSAADAADPARSRANLTLLGVVGSKLDVLCFAQTPGILLAASFSSSSSSSVLTLEQSPTSEFPVDACVYRVSGDALRRQAATTVPLRAAATGAAWSPKEDKVVVGVADGSVVMYDGRRQTTQITQISLTPSTILWHPNGAVVVVAGARGQIQLLDAGLGALRFCLLSETPSPSKVFDVASHFRSPPSALTRVEWACPSPSSIHRLLLAFDEGPVGAVVFQLGMMAPFSGTGLTHKELILDYLRHQQIDQAINLLSSIDWDILGDDAFSGLTLVFDHLLRLPLNPEREAWLESLLGCFYSAPSTKPWSRNTSLLFKEPMSRYARRFFHHLLRYSRFEKAFLLAVDIGSHDLFMDIHYLALDKGNTGLADAARRKAEDVDRRGEDDDDEEEEGETGSSSSSSSSSAEDDDDPDENDNNLRVDEIIPGVPATTPISALTPAQIQALAKGVERMYAPADTSITDRIFPPSSSSAAFNRPHSASNLGRSGTSAPVRPATSGPVRSGPDLVSCPSSGSSDASSFRYSQSTSALPQPHRPPQRPYTSHFVSSGPQRGMPSGPPTGVPSGSRIGPPEPSSGKFVDGGINGSSSSTRHRPPTGPTPLRANPFYAPPPQRQPQPATQQPRRRPRDDAVETLRRRVQAEFPAEIPEDVREEWRRRSVSLTSPSSILPSIDDDDDDDDDDEFGSITVETGNYDTVFGTVIPEHSKPILLRRGAGSAASPTPAGASRTPTTTSGVATPSRLDDRGSPGSRPASSQSRLAEERRGSASPSNGRRRRSNSRLSSSSTTPDLIGDAASLEGRRRSEGNISTPPPDVIGPGERYPALTEGAGERYPFVEVNTVAVRGFKARTSPMKARESPEQRLRRHQQLQQESAVQHQHHPESPPRQQLIPPPEQFSQTQFKSQSKMREEIRRQQQHRQPQRDLQSSNKTPKFLNGVDSVPIDERRRATSMEPLNAEKSTPTVEGRRATSTEPTNGAVAMPSPERLRAPSMELLSGAEQIPGAARRRAPSAEALNGTESIKGESEPLKIINFGMV